MSKFEQKSLIILENFWNFKQFLHVKGLNISFEFDPICYKFLKDTCQFLPFVKVESNFRDTSSQSQIVQ